MVTNQSNVLFVKERVSNVYSLNISMPVVWCPLGIHLKEGPYAYLKFLCLHRNFLADITLVSIFGILKDSLDVQKAIASGTVHSFRSYILKSTGAIDIART